MKFDEADTVPILSHVCSAWDPIIDPRGELPKSRYSLYKDSILVHQSGSSKTFAANSADGTIYLTINQSPVSRIYFTTPSGWHLILSDDGSAELWPIPFDENRKWRPLPTPNRAIIRKGAFQFKQVLERVFDANTANSGIQLGCFHSGQSSSKLVGELELDVARELLSNALNNIETAEDHFYDLIQQVPITELAPE